MAKKNSSTRWVGDNTSKKISITSEEFSVNGKDVGATCFEPTFNLLDYRTKGFDINRIKMAVLRAKQDYGKAFEKLAAED